MIENNRYYWSHLKTKSVTVRVAPKRRQSGVVFRVRNMVDLGFGRQTVTLEHVDYPRRYHQRGNCDVAVPFQMGNLDFVYTSMNQPKVQNISDLLSFLYKDEEVHKIVPDVLTPGDLLVFKQEPKSLEIKMIEALRVVQENAYKKQTRILQE